LVGNEDSGRVTARSFLSAAAVTLADLVN